MISNLPRISVLVITYKQEFLIKRALDSLLKQKEYIYEICVSDDCSPDNTWNILLEYKEKYPDLFKLHRNETNIGIFENIEYTWTMPSGDIVYQLSGDDEVGADWFETVIKFIRDKNINISNDFFSIYGDYEAIYPNSDSIIYKNNLVNSKINILSSSLRGYISNRSACFSINVLKCFKKVSIGKSHIAELIQDRQLQVFSKNNYYIPHIGNKYYVEVGVSTHINCKSDKGYALLKEREQIRPYAIETFERMNVIVSLKDKYFMLYQKERITNKITGDKNWLTLIKYRIKGFDLRYCFKKNHILKYIFLLKRKVRHNKTYHLYY